MTDKQWRWVKVILSVPGAVGFFLPFTWGVSPLEATSNWPSDWDIGSLGLVMGLAFFVVLLHLRHASNIGLLWSERFACVTLGVAGSLLIAATSVYGVIKDGFGTAHPALIIAAILPVWVLPAAQSLAVIRFRKVVFGDSAAALAALMVGYLPNAVFCLLAFWKDWDTGAYFVLLTCLCYIGMIVATVRRLRVQGIQPAPE